MTYNIKEIVKYSLNLGVVLEVYENFSECFDAEIEIEEVDSAGPLWTPAASIGVYDYYPIDDSVEMSQGMLELCFELPDILRTKGVVNDKCYKILTGNQKILVSTLELEKNVI